MDVLGAVPGTYVRLLFDYLAAHHLDAGALLHEAPPVPVARGLDRYPVTRWRALLERAAEALQDPLLGLHVGATITPAALGVLGYVFMACGTLGAALQRFARYQRLVYDVNPFIERVVDGNLVLEWSAENGRPGAQVDECAIAALVQFARDITGQAWQVPRIDFVNPEPADVQPYRDYFGSAVCFGQAATRVQLPLSLLALSLRRPDAALLDLLSRQVDAQLAELPAADALERRVRRVIARRIPETGAGLDEVAAELHVSPRTLHRRLAARGTTFRALCEDTRRHLAEDYLRDERLQLAEIAQLLGFSEQSAFTHAYRRWTGLSPGRFRRRLAR